MSKKEGTPDNGITGDTLIQRLPHLRRKVLEKVAESAILSSSASVVAAASCLETYQDRSSLIRCVRCKERYDPDRNGFDDCVMYDHCESEGMIERGSSGLCWLYPCCHQEEDESDPCWIGKHIASWDDVSVRYIDRGQTYYKFNDGGYWKDQDKKSRGADDDSSMDDKESASSEDDDY